MTKSDRGSGSNANGDLRERIWSELQRGCAERQHAWHAPVLATTGLDGTPQARTVVLREVRPSARQLLFYTDRRSPKVAELTRQPSAMLVFWSRELQWQLRLKTRLSVEIDGAGVEAAWEYVRQSGSSADYLTPHAPGAALVQINQEAAEIHQLALLIAQVESVDWLELERGGHRRARIDETGVQWLVP